MTQTFEERFLAARREYISSRFPDLNDRQREAVLATEGPLLVLAGAGSGKTTVLINRIYNIMRYGSASDSDEIPDFADEAALCMAANGIKPEKVQSNGASRFREVTKVPVHRLIARLGIKKYDVAAPLQNGVVKASQVRIPLKMHIGAPCDPVVKVGQKVKVGDVIGQPPEGKLGVNIHASINGTVRSIENGYVVIG